MKPKMLVSEAAQRLGTTVQSVHKKIKENNLETFKEHNRVYFTHSTAKHIFKYEYKPLIYSFQLVKGGVGKTVIATNFAVRSSLLGARVLIVELDQQANITRTLNVDASDKPVMIDLIANDMDFREGIVNVHDGLDIIPSRVDNALLDNHLLLGRKALDRVFTIPLNKLKSEYDVIVIDCPPSIGAAVTAAALSSDVIVMPINPSDYSIAGLDITFNEIKSMFEQYDKSAEIKIVFNKYDARTNLSFQTMSDIIKHPTYSNHILQSYIRSLQGIENIVSSGQSVFDNFKSTPEREDFSALTDDLLTEVK
ncbi:ParA family protein [Francisellaceae bacterium]|nr:ParA family protein [Francisellaceae bacterium]